MNAPKLSICIATLNRAAYIGETLDSLLPQDDAEVEIVILDGGSTDGTANIVERYAAQHPCLRYVRMPSPSGVDRDYDLAVQHASGEYCWLMTDDDVLKPGAVRRVLDELREPYSLVVVNAEVCDTQLSTVLEPRRLHFAEPRQYGPEESDRLFADAGQFLTFIGCVVIRRDIWLDRERAEYYGSLFIHVGVIFQKHLPGATLVLADTLISIRYGNAMWRPRDFEIWMFKWPSLAWSFQTLSTESRAAVTAQQPWRELPRLLFYRAKGSYSLAEYRKWIEPACDSSLVRTGPLAIALIPGFLANWVALIYFHCIDREHGMGLLDTRNSRFHFRNWFRSKRAA